MVSRRTTSRARGEELERVAEGTARSDIGVDDAEVAEAYQAQQAETARINEFNREEFQKKLAHIIRTFFTITIAGIGWLFVIAIAGATLFVMLLLIAIVVAHYLIPQWDWLEPDQLKVLRAWYANYAQFIVPAVLVSNAWLVSYVSIKWWRGTTTQSSRDN